jgi:hypothetical protein
MKPSSAVTLPAASQIAMSAARAMLHLTNGSAIIGMMRQAGIDGPIIAWDDVLHEGPVPAGLGPSALRERRAEFLAGCGWGASETILRSLAERDAVLEGAAALRVEEIVLWFEHDLYDQLQLLQILDRLPLDGSPRVTAVPDEEYLGLLPVARFPDLWASRRDVTSACRLAARDAWDAFRSPDPRAVVDVLPRVTVLPHMSAALTRHLQQFPSIENGLSRTEQQALEAVAAGVTRLGDVYARAHHEREEAIFMGDAAFLIHVGALVRPPRPLLRTSRGSAGLSLDDEVSVTEDGRRVLAGDIDRVRTCGIDRWLGGVQLSGNGPVWRWDRGRQQVRNL